MTTIQSTASMMEELTLRTVEKALSWMLGAEGLITKKKMYDSPRMSTHATVMAIIILTVLLTKF